MLLLSTQVVIISDWKHAPGKSGSLYLHANSTAHSSAMVAWQQFKLNCERNTTLAHRMDSLGEQIYTSVESALHQNNC